MGLRLEDPLDKHPGEVNLIGGDLAHLDELVDLGDGRGPRHGHGDLEVLSRPVELKVAVGVATARADKRIVGRERGLQDRPTAVELALLLALSDDGADPGRGEEGRDARATRADALGQGALRDQLHVDGTLGVLLLDVGVAAHERALPGANLAVMEEHREPLPLVTAVVADDGQPLAPLSGDGLDDEELVIRVEGCERVGCNGDFFYAGERNDRPCYTNRRGTGALYFDGTFWKICQIGEGPDESGQERGKVTGVDPTMAQSNLAQSSLMIALKAMTQRRRRGIECL